MGWLFFGSVVALMLAWLYWTPHLQPTLPLLKDQRDFVCRRLLPAGLRRLLCADLQQPDQLQPKVEPQVEHGPQLRLFTPAELALYDGGPGSRGLYLALLGSVFDVQEGAQHYKPGGGYSFFAGRDASRAYVTGDFTETGLVDDVEGLDDQSLLGIEEWLQFYETDYKYVGKVIGRFYNENGDPTLALQRVLAAVERAKNNKRDEEEEKKIFPPCNSEWSSEKGGRVWCTSMSGGVDRSWSGVPRKLFRPGHTEARCACIRDRGPPSDDPKSTQHRDRGDLDRPDLKEYEGCPPDASSCQIVGE